ncbi:FapA family protein [Shewanella sp. A3A]|nr:FapA family protein [Shewanella ferrihydritica]
MLTPDLLNFSGDGLFAELKLIPNSDGPVSEEAVRELLTLPEFNKLFPIDFNIKKAVKDINALANDGEGKTPIVFKIAERRDGQILLETSNDKMQASMTLVAPWGGKQPTLPDILRSLKEKGINMGLSRAKIEAMLHKLPQLNAGESVSGVIAIGKPAINGIHASLIRKVPLARERLLHPQEREDGTVDMRNLGSVVMVSPNDVLMEITHATPGTLGYTVYGDVLQPKVGKDLTLNAGPGTHIDPDDETKLIATVAGQPVEINNGMQVDDVLQIKEVNVGYGNVDFKGSVLITGDVCEGMQVRSSGDITVMGFVESATLEADGDITVSKGVLGRQLGGNELSTKLTAKGQISAQFVQYSALTSQKDILITKQLLHSHTNTESKLIVSDATGRRGDLIGGRAYAEKGIEAVTIGATADTKTEVLCAMNLETLKLRLKDLEDSSRSLFVAKLDLEARLRRLPPKEEWQNDPNMVDQVKMMLAQKHRVEAELAREETEKDLLGKETEDYYANYFIEAKTHIYSNVEVHIGSAIQRTQREHGPCHVHHQHGELNFDYSAKK